MRFSASVGAEHHSLLLFGLPLLPDLCASGLRCFVSALAAPLVQSQQPFLVTMSYNERGASKTC